MYGRILTFYWLKVILESGLVYNDNKKANVKEALKGKYKGYNYNILRGGLKEMSSIWAGQ